MAVLKKNRFWISFASGKQNQFLHKLSCGYPETYPQKNLILRIIYLRSDFLNMNGIKFYIITNDLMNTFC